MKINDLIHAAKIDWTDDFTSYDLLKDADMQELSRRLSDEQSLGETRFIVINRRRLKPLVLNRTEIMGSIRGHSRWRPGLVRELLANPEVADLTVALNHRNLDYIRAELKGYLRAPHPGVAPRSSLRDRLRNFHRVRLAQLDESDRVSKVGVLLLGPIQTGRSLFVADIDRQGNIIFNTETDTSRPHPTFSFPRPKKASGSIASPSPPAFRVTGQPPPSGGGKTDEDDEGISIKRFPSIKADQKAIRGNQIVIIVDLLREDLDPETKAKPMVIEDLSPNWKEATVEVELICDLIDFDTNRGEIKVRRNEASLSCAMKGSVNADVAENQPIMVVAFFEYAGRTCGVARREVRVELLRGPEAGGKPMSFDGNGKRPDLTVRIFQLNPSKPGMQLWSVAVDRNHWAVKNLPRRRDGSIDLGRGAREFSNEWRGQFESLKPGQHLQAFQSFGEELWNWAPECFRKTYSALRAALGPGFTIQFISDDPYIPWELMRPKAIPGEDPPDLLLQTHPLARFIAELEGNLKNNLRDGLVTTIAPNYPKEKDKLKRAQEEAAFLKREYKAVPIGTTLEDVLTFLEKGYGKERIGVVHFAGHGKFNTGLPNSSSILLTNGSLKAMDVNRQEVELGVKDSPLVIFNACETGSNGALLATVGGWANSFLSREFGGFIAPLWAVDDPSAIEVIKELFEALFIQKVPIGQAMLGIRRKHGGESPTFFAYVFYGDVNACIIGSPSHAEDPNR